MRKLFLSYLLIVTFLMPDMIFITPAYAGEENYFIKKIKLGSFSLSAGKPVSGDYSVHWWEINANLLALDDGERIYVLDVYKKRVLQFGTNGDFINEVTLKDINFPYAGTGEAFFYMMQTSSDGKFFYIVGGSDELKWTIFNSDGVPIKKDITLMKFNRRCNDKFSVYKDILDVNLNRLKRIKVPDIYRGEIFDSMDNFYSLDQTLLKKKPILVKTGPDGRKIWKKDIAGYRGALKMLGIDGADSIFILMDGPFEIVKVNKEGKQVAIIPLPNDLLVSNKETVGNNFRVLCNGTLFYLPTANIPKKKDKSEYFIYKFEMIKSVK